MTETLEISAVPLCLEKGSDYVSVYLPNSYIITV